MENFDLKKYLAEGKLLKEDMASEAISILKSYEGKRKDGEGKFHEIEGLENYIKYIMKTNTNPTVFDDGEVDNVSSAIQAVADDMDRDNDVEDSLRRDLEKLSLSEGKILKEEITWDIDAYDDAADVSDAADDFLPEVKRLIQQEIGDEMIDGELEEYIEVSNDYYYRKARKNAQGSDPENISITAKAFADDVIENYKEDQ